MLSADELVWLCGQGLNGNYQEPKQQIMEWETLTCTPIETQNDMELPNKLKVLKGRAYEWMITLRILFTLHSEKPAQFTRLFHPFSYASGSHVKSPSVSCNEIKNNALPFYISRKNYQSQSVHAVKT